MGSVQAQASTLQPSLMTLASSVPTTMQPPEEEQTYYKGLALALSSCAFIGASFVIKKKGLLNVARNSSNRAGSGGYAYLREWLWWTGMITMIVGEGANFAAYAFAPAILVTPLGALSVLVSAVLSSYLLKERLNLHGKVGCLLCIIGSTILVIHAPHEEEVRGMLELELMLRAPAFIVYVVGVLLFSLFLIFYVSRRYGTTNILVYIGICSLIGSLTVLCCKGIGLALKQTLSGDSQFKNPIAWMFIVGGVACVIVQMNFLNKALDIFNTSIVTPIYYVIFTTFTIIASAILYREWSGLGAKDSLGSLMGFMTIMLGVFLLHAFHDIKFSWRDLYGTVQPERPSRTLQNGETAILVNNLELEEDEVTDSDEKYVGRAMNNHNDRLHSEF